MRGGNPGPDDGPAPSPYLHDLKGQGLRGTGCLDDSDRRVKVGRRQRDSDAGTAALGCVLRPCAECHVTESPRHDADGRCAFRVRTARGLDDSGS